MNEITIFKPKYLSDLRKELVEETGFNISDEDWNKIIKKIEDDIIKDLKEEIPKTFFSTLCDFAEKGDIIIKIDDIDLGEAIRKKKSAMKNQD